MEFSGNVRRERRKTPRTTLKKILYVNLESGNGGIVLNLSDGGLAFRSVAPVGQHGPVRLWFSLSNDHRLEASGELIWSDQTKKTGGVRFTNLPDSARAQIRNLTGESSILGGPSINPLPSPPASAEPETIQESAAIPRTLTIQELKAIQEPAAGHEPSIGYERPARQEPVSVPAGAPAITFQSLAHDNDTPRRPQPLPSASWGALPVQDAAPSLPKVVAGLLAILSITGAGLYAYSHSHEVGAVMVQLGERLEGTSRVALQSPPQVSQSPTPTSPVPIDPPAAPGQAAIPAAEPGVAPAAPTGAAENLPAERSPTLEQTTEGRATEVPVRETPRAAVSPRPHVASRPIEKQASAPPAEQDQDSETDLELAQRYLNGTGQGRNSAAAAQFLWAAVAKGNSSAERALANLYLNGDGVAKSCEQARVLLQAASSKGDAEATQTLSDLGRNRCR